MDRKHYFKVDAVKLVEIEDSALQKLEANKERPLSEASIEARTVLQLINTLREVGIFVVEKGACWY